MDVSIQIKCCKSSNYRYTLRTTYKTCAWRREQLPARVIRHVLKEFRFPRAGLISPDFSYFRARCLHPANCIGSFLEAVEGERLLRRLPMQLSDEDRMEGAMSCHGQAARWARHGWLTVDLHGTAGNAVFHSGNDCAVAVFSGDVSSAEKEYFKEGVEVYLYSVCCILKFIPRGDTSVTAVISQWASAFCSLFNIQPLLSEIGPRTEGIQITRAVILSLEKETCESQARLPGSLLCPSCFSIIP